MKRLWATLALALYGFSALGHVGSPAVVFEGKAGRYPLRVVIQPPEVVPGLAEISVRALGAVPDRITVLPIHWRTDRRGSPRPDVATPTSGDTNLFSAALWLMAHGAYGVEVSAEGSDGGSIVVPVNAVALTRKSMSPGLSLLLRLLGFGLAFGLVAILAAAFRESTLGPGETFTANGRIRAWLGATVGLAAASGLIVLGSRWWNSVDAEHQRRGIFRPLERQWLVDTKERTLRLTLTDGRMQDANFALTPDHGKLVHAFLIQEAPAPGQMPVLAHLHPVRGPAGAFASAWPDVPAGAYRVYTDLTHESGLTETLTNTIQLEPVAESRPPTDVDDSWTSPAAPGEPGHSVDLGGGLRMTLVGAAYRAGEPLRLVAKVVDAAGAATPLEPYLRMLGHALVEREDGQVFTHIHPAGTLSLAAAREFAEKLGGPSAARFAEGNCGDLSALPQSDVQALTGRGEVGFPYLFPSPGRYRLWVQVRVRGDIRTGGFGLTVTP